MVRPWRKVSPAAADRKRWVNPTKVKRYKELVWPSLTKVKLIYITTAV